MGLGRYYKQFQDFECYVSKTNNIVGKIVGLILLICEILQVCHYKGVQSLQETVQGLLRVFPHEFFKMVLQLLFLLLLQEVFQNLFLDFLGGLKNFSSDFFNIIYTYFPLIIAEFLTKIFQEIQ